MELKEKIANAMNSGSPEAILELAKSEGYELSEDQLSQIAGGWGGSDLKCPNCGSDNLEEHTDPSYVTNIYCRDCGSFVV